MFLPGRPSRVILEDYLLLSRENSSLCLKYPFCIIRKLQFLFILVQMVYFVCASLTFGQFMEGADSNSDFRGRQSPSKGSVASGKVQSDYPAIAKIVGRGKLVAYEEIGQERGNNRDLRKRQSVYYGSGVYVAEHGGYGIVLTNWHVVAESEESIQVMFGNFMSDGFVLLADEVWDLAAIVIRTPPFLPVPISLEVPQLGDELWITGYGQYAGLDEFRIQVGTVLRYVVLGTQDNLPSETLAIDVGARQGDSGGPILNKYGEVAGLLWGSDGKLTMGTFSLRVQAFLTQAQFQLFGQPQVAEAFFQNRERHPSIRKIQMPATSAQLALQASGIFPISSRPIYSMKKEETTANRNNAIYPGINSDIPTTASANKRTPPFPPIESPTLAAQQKLLNREHPEVYTREMLAQINAMSTKSPELVVLDSGISDKDKSIFRGVSMSSPSGKTTIPSISPGRASSRELAQNDLDHSEGNNQPEVSQEQEGQNSANKIVFKLQASDIQIILVVIIIFFLFFNAVRLMATANEK